MWPRDAWGRWFSRIVSCAPLRTEGSVCAAAHRGIYRGNADEFWPCNPTVCASGRRCGPGRDGHAVRVRIKAEPRVTPNHPGVALSVATAQPHREGLLQRAELIHPRGARSAAGAGVPKSGRQQLPSLTAASASPQRCPRWAGTSPADHRSAPDIGGVALGEPIGGLALGQPGEQIRGEAEVELHDALGVVGVALFGDLGEGLLPRCRGEDGDFRPARTPAQERLCPVSGWAPSSANRLRSPSARASTVCTA